MIERKHRMHEIAGGIVPAYLWDSHMKFDDNVVEQIEGLMKLPFMKHIALMPDGHLGKGCAIGSVIVTEGRAIIPASVGVDIGCGMMAIKTSIKQHQLPDSLEAIRDDVYKVVPVGSSPQQRGRRGGRDSSVWGNAPDLSVKRWNEDLADGYAKIIERNPKIDGKNTVNQLGTLGSGNHFIEVCVDESDDIWVMLHSGSRGSGNRIGTFFINKAKEAVEHDYRAHMLDDKNLAYLVDDPKNPDDMFSHYIGAMLWAQNFAKINREIMMDNVLGVLRNHITDFDTTDMAINCHHNYAQKEHHFGGNYWVTRKGATNASEGTLGIIPGSMATGSFIVKGLGNPLSANSCSHGAGRVMSRNKARELISLEKHIEDTKGVLCRQDEAIIDESPSAYKPIAEVMKAQSDLVEIMYHLKPLINWKG